MSQNSYLSDVSIQNILDEHAQALTNGTLNRKALLQKYGVSAEHNVVKLLDIAEQTYNAYQKRQPNPEFVNHLYRELIGESSRPFWARFGRHNRLADQKLPNLPNLNQVDLTRWKELPPAMQLAAGIGGLTLMWIAARAVRDTIGAVDTDDGLFTELSAS